MENDNEFGGQFGKAPELSDDEINNALDRLSTRANRYERKRNVLIASSTAVIVCAIAVATFALARGKKDDAVASKPSTTSTSSVSTSLSSTTSTSLKSKLITSSTLLTFDGLGPLKIDATISDIERSNPQLTVKVSAQVASGPKCIYDVSQNGAYLVSFFDASGKGVLQAISIDDKDLLKIKTDKGIGVGSTAAQIRKAYPKAVDLYGDGTDFVVNADGSSLGVGAPGAGHQFRFTLDQVGGTVRAIQAGNLSEEYCA